MSKGGLRIYTCYDPEAQSFFCLSTTYVPREEVFAIAESVQRID